MKKNQLQGQTVGTLDVQHFFELFAKLLGDEHGLDIKVTSIRKRSEKETGRNMFEPAERGSGKKVI